MITTEHLRIYKKYDGDMDFFAKMGRKNEKALFEGNTWRLLEDYERGLKPMAKGLASEEEKAKTLVGLKRDADGAVYTEMTKDL